jgi:hypothetical protein
MSNETVPVGVRLTREQMARLTADGQKVSPAVRALIDFEPMAPVHAAAILSVAPSNLSKVPGLPAPRWSPEAGDKVTGRLYDARAITALAAKLAEERAKREAGCGHEPRTLNSAGRCRQCEVERVRAYKQAQKQAAA